MFIGCGCGFGWLWLSWGLCGFCAREVFGGYKVKSEKPANLLAALLYGLIGFCSCLYYFALVLCWLVLLFLLFCLCGLWFSFPSDGMTKRKGAPCWCVLASWVVGLWLSYCVGYYETIAGGFYP